MTDTATDESPMIEVRNSPVHGSGVFALRDIPKGTRIIEYVGDRISHEESDKRYEDHDPDDPHTFLFIVNKKIVIDAEVGGNESRYINHSCDPNCESVIEKERVFIEAIRAIEPGEELNYDYQIGREPDDPPNVDEVFRCMCGAATCRGTLLWPAKRPAAKKLKKKAKKNVKQAKRSKKTTQAKLAKQAKKSKKSSQAKQARKSKRSSAAKNARGTASKRAGKSQRKTAGKKSKGKKAKKKTRPARKK